MVSQVRHIYKCPSCGKKDQIFEAEIHKYPNKYCPYACRLVYPRAKMGLVEILENIKDYSHIEAKNFPL